MATAHLLQRPVPGPTAVSPAPSSTPSHPGGGGPELDAGGRGPAGTGLRADIQGLRALAVVLVVADHAGLPGFAGGYIGVDVFFVISGHVITRLLLREAGGESGVTGIVGGLARFYSRRIRRIVPAATVTLVATMVLSALVLRGRLDPALAGDVRWASLFGGNWRLIATSSGYFVAGVHPSLVTQFWSLGVEEQFYLCFPVTVFLIAGLVPPPHRLRVLSAAVLAGVVVSAWWSVHISGAEPTAAYYSPFTRFWELGTGALLATGGRSRLRRTVRAEHLAAALGVGAVLGALMVLGPRSTYPGWRAVLPCAGAALLLWAGAGGARVGAVRVLSWRPVVYVGNLSYSIYLVHYLWLMLPGRLAPPLAGWPWRLAELGATFLTAAGSYHLVENPLRRSQRLAADGPSVVLLLLVCVSACWAAAAWAPRLGG